MSGGPYRGWRAPAPLIPLAARDSHAGRVMEPTILRFAGDKFMAEFLAVMQAEQPNLAPLAARPEDGKHEGAGWLPLESPYRQPLKLYQVTQGRAYLAAAELVDCLPGLPAPSPTALPPAVPLPPPPGKASLLVRRLAPLLPEQALVPENPATYQEFGWVPGGVDGPGWHPVAPEQALPGEERLPLFAIPYGTGGQQRLLHAGIIPVGSREQYVAGPLTLPKPWPPPDHDPRPAIFAATAADRLTDLLIVTEPVLDEPLSTMLLVDLAGFLEQYLPGTWQQIRFRPRWAANLKQAWAARAQILAGDPGAPVFNLAGTLLPRDLAQLTEVVAMLLRQQESGPLYRVESPLFAVRLLLEAPQDQPGPPLLSRPSQPFHLAAHDEAGAPERPESGAAADRTALVKALVKLLLPELRKKRKEGEP